ncbi:hypothetical protein [uncultured Bacteroides sp.]|uniref:hypothetical protein n=1 Tax=uncultured Bacteroides sp. TaxID=162156 RepID=UPI002611B207|nr:hypothetical protein [uncultured Bacteroides sp.]
MKTRTLIESIKSRAFYLMLCITMAVAFSACSEEVLEDDIAGEYIGGSEETGDILIRINKSSSGYNFYCRYEDWGAANSRLNLQSVEWKGTFTNIPSDVVKNSKGEEIGEIEFTKTSDYVKVEFTSYTDPKGKYSAKKGGEMADLL